MARDFAGNELFRTKIMYYSVYTSFGQECVFCSLVAIPLGMVMADSAAG